VLSWLFALAGRGVWGRVRLWNSRLDREMIASGTHHRKEFTLMSQSYQMTFAMHQKLCRPACYQRLQSCHVLSLSVACSERQGQKVILHLGGQRKSCHDAQVGALPLLSVWFEACTEHLHLLIFQGWW